MFALASRRRCAWSLVLLGVCGCAEPVRQRPIGSYLVVDRDLGDVQRRPEGEETDFVIAAGERSGDNAAELDRVYMLALDAFPEGEWSNFGPDSGFREIALTCSRGRFLLRSWHPLFEVNSELVVASNGVSALDGQTRESFLANDDPRYIRERNAFDAIDEALRELSRGTSSQPD